MSHPQAPSSPIASSSVNAENHDARLDELLNRLQGLTGKEAPIKAAEPLPPGIKEGEFFPKAVTSVGFAAMAQMLVELADHTCAGRLVMSHEGGYSPVYVPYCGLAVLEAMSGISTGVVDPFIHLIPFPTQVVPRPFQLEPVVEATALVRDLESILMAQL